MIIQLIYYYLKNKKESEKSKKGTEKKVSDEQNCDISESHISIVRKSELSGNEENDLLVEDRNNGEVKEDEVELSKDNITDIGEENKDHGGIKEEEGKEIIVCSEDSKKPDNNFENKDNILVDLHSSDIKEFDWNLVLFI